MKKKFKIVSLLLIAVPVAAILLWFCSRDWLLHNQINKFSNRFAGNHDLDFKFTKPQWVGFKTVCIERMELRSKKSGTIFLATKIEITPGMGGLTGIGNSISELKMDSFLIHLDKWPRKKSKTVFHNLHPVYEFLEKIERVLHIASSLEIQKGILIPGTNSIPSLKEIIFKFENHQAFGSLSFENAASERKRLEFGGFWNHNKFGISVLSNDWVKSTTASGVSGFDLNENTQFNFDSFQFKMNGKKTESGEFEIFASGNSNHPILHSPALAVSVLKFGNFGFEANLKLSRNCLSAEVPAKFISGEVKSNILFRWPSVEKQECKFEFQFPETEVRKWLNVLPEGDFHQLRSLNLSGSFGGKFQITFVPGNLESFQLSRKWNQSVQVGPSDQKSFPGLLNSRFIYHPQGSNRQILADPIASHWVPLGSIPPILKQCVLLSEDPDFFKHKGINPDFLLTAAKENLASAKFMRGGSTISMQLVRNIFLSREKTLCRKTEEIALTWLMENSGQVSKDRILELYLNLAEWGPEVYGVREAAIFYFHKSLKQLSADECIFLAGLLPNPKMYKTQFSEDGSLKPLTLEYFDGMKLNLFDLGLMDENQLEKAVEVKLRP